MKNLSGRQMADVAKAMVKNSNQPKHTPGTWRAVTDFIAPSSVFKTQEDMSFALFIDSPAADIKPALVFGRTQEEAEANANRISRSVNMYDDLIKHLKKGIFNSETLLATFHPPESREELENEISDMKAILKETEGK